MDKALVTVCTFLGTISFLCSQWVEKEQTIYYPDSQSLMQHRLPTWYEDAKFGIFVHWGLYSVPAWAPTSGTFHDLDPEEWVWNKAYAEWYMNSMHLKGSPTWKHHIATYGKDFDYYSFIPLFNKAIQNWNPEEWAELFKEAGAKYVILTSKHHDGFPLWPSQVNNPNFPPDQARVSRDLVRELTVSIREKGLRMGLYYSGGLDWSFYRTPIVDERYMLDTVPQGFDYCVYADSQLRELILRYHPAILWNDISYPKNGNLEEIIANYYNLVPDGLINDRWGRNTLFDFRTTEYEKTNQASTDKWEATRGMGFSFGYNQVEDESVTLTINQIVDLLVDVVSKNGNLLLNVGPQADGKIPAIQEERLRGVGKWLQVNGEAIYGTKPWFLTSGSTASGNEVRFTQNEESLYVILLDSPDNNQVILKEIHSDQGTEVKLLGRSEPLQWQQTENGMQVVLPPDQPSSAALSLKISPKPWLLAKKPPPAR